MKRAALVIAIVLGACLNAGDDRARADLEVGTASAGDNLLRVEGGLARVRQMEPGRLVLWASAPVVRMTLGAAADAPRQWEIEVRNALPDAELGGDAADVEVLPADRGTVHRWRVDLEPGAEHDLVVGPPDAGEPGTFRFVALADIQQAMDRVDEVFEHISARDDVRFVMFMGDLTDEARVEEYALFERQREALDIPFYGTIGNHELWDEPERWRERFGRYNVHFAFKDVAFTFLDSGNGAIAPLVHDWLDDWLEAAADRVHVFGTHYPPIDPVGVRSGSFRNRAEAAWLLNRLAAADVDLTLYGHIHSYHAFSNAGIPAYISGGGGAWPERWDGIERHYLVVEVTGGRGVDGVAVVRVD